jgi:hypothetical protein
LILAAFAQLVQVWNRILYSPTFPLRECRRRFPRRPGRGGIPGRETSAHGLAESAGIAGLRDATAPCLLPPFLVVSSEFGNGGEFARFAAAPIAAVTLASRRANRGNPNEARRRRFLCGHHNSSKTGQVVRRLSGKLLIRSGAESGNRTIGRNSPAFCGRSCFDLESNTAEWRKRASWYGGFVQVEEGKGECTAEIFFEMT